MELATRFGDRRGGCGKAQIIFMELRGEIQDYSTCPLSTVGLQRDIDMVIHYACAIETVAKAEMEARVEHLAAASRDAARSHRNWLSSQGIVTAWPTRR